MENTPIDESKLIVKLLEENQVLLRENNTLLHKHERRERRRLIFKIIWYTILLGIPMFAYYYLYNTFLGLTGGEQTNVPEAGLTIPANALEELLRLYGGH